MARAATQAAGSDDDPTNTASRPGPAGMGSTGRRVDVDEKHDVVPLGDQTGCLLLVVHHHCSEPYVVGVTGSWLMPSSRPPMAPRRPHEMVAHGRVRVDDWYWLADRDDPAVLAYLEAENEYTDEVLAPTKPLQESLFEDIKGEGPGDRRRATYQAWAVVVFLADGGGKAVPHHVPPARPDQDPDRGRGGDRRQIRAGPDGNGEQVLLDENLLGAGKDYLAVGVFDVSPDHATLAYAVDLDGSESYTLRFRDLATGIDQPDVVEGVYYGSAWALDNRTSSSTFAPTRPCGLGRCGATNWGKLPTRTYSCYRRTTSASS